MKTTKEQIDLLPVSTPTCKDLESNNFSSHRKTETTLSFQFHQTMEITGLTSTLKTGKTEKEITVEENGPWSQPDK